MKEIEPCGHRVLIKPETVEDADPMVRRAKAMGIDVSQITNNKREQEAVVFGTILKVGPTAWAHESLGGKPWAKIGDQVMYAKFSGKRVELADQEELLLLNDEDIVAIVKEG